MNQTQIKNYIVRHMDYLEGKISIAEIDSFLSSKGRITYYHKTKRLNKLGVKSKLLLKKYKFLNNENVIPITFESDGINTHAFWFFKYVAREQFEYGNKKKIIKYGEVKTKYAFVKSNHQKNIVCPNCGNECIVSSEKQCSYCGTIINDDATSIKLNNFNLWMRDKTIRGGEKYIIAGLLISVLSLSLLLPIGAYLIYLGFKKGSETEEKQKQIKEQEILNINGTNIASLNILKEDVINKVKQIHFVDNLNPIRYFVNTDISKYIDIYNNVVACNIINVFLTNFSCDENNNYLTYELILSMCYKNNDIEEQYEKVILTLAKDKKTSLHYSDNSKLFACKSCGSNDVDYLNNGTCNYCNKSLNSYDNISYDWILVNYQAEFISYKK